MQFVNIYASTRRWRNKRAKKEVSRIRTPANQSIKNFGDYAFMQTWWLGANESKDPLIVYSKLHSCVEAAKMIPQGNTPQEPKHVCYLLYLDLWLDLTVIGSGQSHGKNTVYFWKLLIPEIRFPCNQSNQHVKLLANVSLAQWRLYRFL